MKKLGWLVAATLLLWAALIYPGWLLWGDGVWLISLSALALCLLPAVGTLVWADRSKDPHMRLVAILGGSGIRMAFALGGGLLLYEMLPEKFPNAFWLWVILFYMFILALETILIVKDKQNSLA
jgi:hypothetical protein